MARGKAAPSGIRVSGADSSRVSHARSSLHRRKTADSWYSPAFK